jgi:C4-dicarboxylate-binding protein DctP
VYANSTLYKDKEEMEALQLGAVQMLAPSLAKFGPLGVKEFELFDLPFIFRQLRRPAQGHDQGPVGKQLLTKLESKGIKRPGILGQRFQVLFAEHARSRRQPTSRARRCASSRPRSSRKQMRAVGALPQVMAFSEVYQALQTGVVDGTENPISNLYTQKQCMKFRSI